MPDDEAEELADRFVDGTSVDFLGIMQTTVGSFLFAGVLAFLGYWLRVAEAIETVVLEISAGISETVSVIMSSYLPILSRGADVTESSLGMFGPAAFPLTVISVAVGLSAIFWGVNTLARY